MCVDRGAERPLEACSGASLTPALVPYSPPARQVLWLGAEGRAYFHQNAAFSPDFLTVFRWFQRSSEQGGPYSAIFRPEVSRLAVFR